jgi:hypothetical protein
MLVLPICCCLLDALQMDASECSLPPDFVDGVLTHAFVENGVTFEDYISDCPFGGEYDPFGTCCFFLGDACLNICWRWIGKETVACEIARLKFFGLELWEENTEVRGLAGALRTFLVARSRTSKKPDCASHLPLASVLQQTAA